MRLFPVFLVAAVLGIFSCNEHPIVDDSLAVDLRVDSILPEILSTAGGEEVILLGQNFSHDVQIKFNQAEISRVAWQSETEISFISPQSFPGYVHLEIANPNGNVVSMPEALYVQTQEVHFIPHDPFGQTEEEIPIGPFAVADLNNDGLDDFLYYRDNYSYPDDVGWVAYMNSGKGFQFEVRELEIDGILDFPINTLVPLDLNADGYPDVVDLGGAVYFNRGDLNFEKGPRITASEDMVMGVWATGHFSGSDKEEIVFYQLPKDLDPFAPEVDWKVRMARIDDQEQAIVQELGFESYGQLIAANFDSDDYTDLLFHDDSYSPAVRHGPDFDSPLWQSDMHSNNLAVHDANQDGWQDILVLQEPIANVYLNDGQSGFADPVEVVNPCWPENTVNLDLCEIFPFAEDVFSGLLLTCRDHTIRVWNYDGDNSASVILDGLDWSRVFTANLDGDPYADMIVMHYAFDRFKAYFGNSSGFVPAWGLSLIEWAPGDELPPNYVEPLLVLGKFESGRMALVFEGKIGLADWQDDKFRYQAIHELDFGDWDLQEAVACDVNGAGFDDLLVVASDNTGQNAVFVVELRDGNAHLQPEPIATLDQWTFSHQLLSGSYSNDALCGVAWLAEEYFALLETSDGSFQAREVELEDLDKVPLSSTLLANSQRRLRTADLNEDTLDDFYGITEQGQLAVYYTQDSASFALQEYDLASQFGDGNISWMIYDAVVVGDDQGNLWIYAVAGMLEGQEPTYVNKLLFKGQITADHQLTDVTQLEFNLESEMNTTRVDVVDLDADGQLDVVARGSKEIKIFLMGVENFREVESMDYRFLGTFKPRYQFLDLDLDGNTDLLFASTRYPGKIVFMKNEAR